jgi:hypothetical protein
MANKVYTKAAQRMFNAALNNTLPVAGTLKATLVKTSYVANLTTDEFYTTISAHVVGTPQALTGVVFADGRLDAADPVFTAVVAGNALRGVVLYVDTGNPATSWLFMCFDSIGGLPFTTNGGDVDPQWDNGTLKILSLVD